MRKAIVISVSFFLVFFFWSCNNMQREDLHVVTFNVRYDNPNDGSNRWEVRIPIIESYFVNENPDVIGMQEVLHNQVNDLLNIMPGYSYVGTGRDDGKQGGEYSPIFYRKDKFNLLENSQFWLSETPEVPGSIGWDAAITRIVTWAKLEQKATGKTFYFFNTHFDHRGVKAREISPHLFSEKITEIAGNAPVIATGDFNIRKNHTTLGSGLYDNLIEIFESNNSLINSLFISESPVTTAGATSNGFREEWKVGEIGDAIDYIFVNKHFEVKLYRVDRIMEDNVFISDHWPVVSVLNF